MCANDVIFDLCRPVGGVAAGRVGDDRVLASRGGQQELVVAVPSTVVYSNSAVSLPGVTSLIVTVIVMTYQVYLLLLQQSQTVFHLLALVGL